MSNEDVEILKASSLCVNRVELVVLCYETQVKESIDLLQAMLKTTINKEACVKLNTALKVMESVYTQLLAHKVTPEEKEQLPSLCENPYVGMTALVKTPQYEGGRFFVFTKDGWCLISW